MASLRAVVPVVAVAVLSLTACSKPKAGGSCTAASPTTRGSFEGTCDGKQAALVCLNGTYTHIKCAKSAVGCMEVMGKVSCNIHEDVGEPCFDREHGCSSDHKKMLTCKDGKWALKMDCKSSLGCVENVEGVRCTSGEASAGDPCQPNQKDQGGCNADKNALLVCDGSKFFVASTCRGQLKCRALGGKIDCDTSLAEVDDPCEEPGALSCDVAKKHLLECTGGKFAVKQACKKHCNNAFKKFSCD